MEKIAVIGTGYVGLVSGTCFAEVGNQVTCCDIDQKKIENLLNGIMPIYEPGLEELVQKNIKKGKLTFTSHIAEAISQANIILITVGTPMTSSGEADLSYVKKVAQMIGENINCYKIIVTKSTVPVGTGKLIESIIKKYANEQPFDMVSNPEFLREGAAINDTFQMERAVIGATSSHAIEIISKLHLPFTNEMVKTNLETAELIKYAANAFLATKISFINDIANICERVGADVTKVSKAMGLDSRIGHKFLQAGVGFGGSCFPKDTAALLQMAKSAGYDFKLMESVMNTNEGQRIHLIDKVVSVLGSLKGKNISVLGLAFKPNTNDIRSSPALDIIPRLVEMGAMVKAYDPVATNEAKKQLSYPCIYSDDVYQTIKGTDACVILTDWKEIKELDLIEVKKLLHIPIIVDGRNLYDLDMMHKLGFTYISIGRPDVHMKSMTNHAI